MKPAAFDFRRAGSVPDALAALADPQADAKPLAGGQSLGPMLNLRLARPGTLVDLGGIEALSRIEDAGAAVRIGACVTHARIEDEAAAIAGIEPLARVARGIAYRGVRNRGTVGGSLVHADPAADWPLALAAFGATVILEGPGGTRRVPAAEFMLGAYATALADGELLTAVEVPRLGAGARWAYRKFCRKPGEFAEAAAAVLLDPARAVARIFVGAPAQRPTALGDLARDLARHGRAALEGDRIARELAAPLADAPADRRQACRTMLERAIDEVLG